jgi:hypothetical protein
MIVFLAETAKVKVGTTCFFLLVGTTAAEVGTACFSFGGDHGGGGADGK